MPLIFFTTTEILSYQHTTQKDQKYLIPSFSVEISTFGMMKGTLEMEHSLPC